MKETNRNWKVYNRKLIGNGSLNLWVDEKLLDNWYQKSNESMTKGRPYKYSDLAMEFCQMVRFVYRQPLRQTEGFIQSILLILKPGLKAPSYTQMSRRMDKFSANLKAELAKIKPGAITTIIFDSSGLKVYGEGEWKVRQYGYSKRRTWRKLHIGIDSETQNIISAELTENNVADSSALCKMMDELPNQVAFICCDGAYDDKQIYNKATKLGIKTLIPPDKNAVISIGKLRKQNPGLSLRNRALIDIQKNILEFNMEYEEARKKWKVDNNYHQRSKVESAFYRLKTRLGDKLASRKSQNQIAESLIKCKILNRFAA